ncbi:MAG TPA: DNA replication/repair protein RecF [Bacteroidota bacterium]|mgnify:FL=1|jgi:DNA replication and repair protein RecF|nr:DNA replication/repair protein RecF [Bacteroidota bacterium]
MRIKSVRLRNFRNHRYTNVNFCDNINIFYGKNGQGKTNILDGLTYLCLTKGFLSSSDSNSVLFGENDFELEANFYSDLNVKSSAKLLYSSLTKSKVLFHNNLKVDKAISFVGLYPIVVLAPQFYSIVNGLPQERRKFVDMVISQSSKSYLQDLVEYKRVLKQRNKLLSDLKNQRSFDFDSIESWNKPLVEYGSKIILKRLNFIKDFIPLFQKAYKQISNANEIPSIKYLFLLNEENISYENIYSSFNEKLIKIKNDEIKRGLSIIGPHKDEFEFKINNFDVRQYASQGQQKTFLVALKLAEFFYLEEKCAEKPVLILDDLFSELDKDRSLFLLNFLKNKCQVFISSTSSQIFDEALIYNGLNNKFLVESGNVIQNCITT